MHGNHLWHSDFNMLVMCISYDYLSVVDNAALMLVTPFPCVEYKEGRSMEEPGSGLHHTAMEGTVPRDPTCASAVMR